MSLEQAIRMADPTPRSEGNLRFASFAFSGLPDDAEEPWASYQKVLDRLDHDGNADSYGPLIILFDLPPVDDQPGQWRCQIGTALTGSASSGSDSDGESLLVEDYRGIQTLNEPFLKPINELPAAYQQLADQARAMGWRLRPYWMVRLHNTSTKDGAAWPACEISVCCDR